MKQSIMLSIIFICALLASTQNIEATYPLTRTFSICPDSLHQIRVAAGLVAGETSDPLISQYWDDYTQSFRNEASDPSDIEQGRAYTNSFGFVEMAINAYTAVLKYDQNPDDYSPILDEIRNDLSEFKWKVYQNAILKQHYYTADSTEVVRSGWNGEWWKLDDYQRARELSYNLLLASFTVDMLYYAHDRSDTTTVVYRQFEDIISDLKAHVEWIHRSFFKYGLPGSANDWNSVGWNINNLYEAGDPNILAPKGMCYDSNENGDNKFLPRINNSVSRFHLICGMGYASILTGLDDMLNHFVKNEFKSSDPLPDQTSYYGFNDYLTTNSGMFVGGLTYQNRLLFLSNLFFTALKRTKGINLYNSNNAWNCDMIPRMVRHTLRRIDPELHHITYGDDWRRYGIESSGGENPDKDNSIQIERGLLSFYYNNTDDPVSQDNIRWYVGELQSANNNTPPREAYEHDFFSSFETVMSYCASIHGGPTSVTSGGTIPSFIAQGTYSDSESSILRSPSNIYSEYNNSHMLVVNHENSFIPYHNNNDTTAYQLYLWGHPVIVEAGYAPYIGDKDTSSEMRYWEWYQSPFSQNILLINPHLPQSSGRLDEVTYLRKDWRVVNNYNLKYEDPMNFTWPISWLSSVQETRPYYDGARKRFLIRNRNDMSSNDIEHLNIHFRYMNSMSNSFSPTPDSLSHNNQEFPCNVFRNFYKVSDKYFLILDEAIFESEPGTPNTFRNQMHLLKGLKSRAVGHRHYIFRPLNKMGNFRYYDEDTNMGMYFAMGSSISGPNTFRQLSSNYARLAWTPHDWCRDSTGTLIGEMFRLSIEAASSKRSESFVTFLYPSTGITNSTNIFSSAIRDSVGYRFIVDDNDRKVFVSLCNDSTISYPNTNYSFVTDAKLMLLEADSDLSSFHEMILTKATLLKAAPSSGTPPDTIFVSHTSGIDETIASWDGCSLYVTFKSDRNLYPRYRIKRCGVMPSQFFSKTEYGLEVAAPNDTTSSARGTLSNNVSTLAYDDNYFYVNYSWDELLINGQLPDGMVIAKGTVPAYQINNNITFNGSIVLTGNLTIQQSGSLNILAGSQITVNNGAGIMNYGTFTIDGGTSRSISIGNEAQTWAGITNSQFGLLNINQATISNANTGVWVRGPVTITNSEIKGCRTGIYIQGADQFFVSGNVIEGNECGIEIIDNITTGNQAIIEENEITQNNYGVKCFNSNTQLTSNHINSNTHAGLLLLHYSEPILMCNTIRLSGSAGTAMPEIRLEGHAYPVMDYNLNDINSDDGVGYSLYYVSSPTSRLQRLDARYNYWGLTNATSIRNSIYPSHWDVVFQPYSLEPNNTVLQQDSPLYAATQAELSGDLPMAKQLYTDIVLTDPQSVEAIQSLGRLNSIYASAPGQFSELHGIYDSYFASCTDSVYVELASSKRVMLDRFDRLYLKALGFYEERLTACDSEMDSLFCLLDIAYTVEEMLNDDQGKSAPEVNYTKHGLQIRSLTEARQTIDQLWEQIMARSETPSELMVPVPTKLDISNYPNPFNPSTTISFAVPKQGNVKLSIYNIKGQKVRELLNERMGRGFHKVVWDGTDLRRSPVASGMYFVVLEVDKAKKAKKIMLMK